MHHEQVCKQSTCRKAKYYGWGWLWAILTPDALVNSFQQSERAPLDEFVKFLKINCLMTPNYCKKHDKLINAAELSYLAAFGERLMMRRRKNL